MSRKKNMVVGKNLKIWRIKKNKKQEEIAFICNFKQPFLSKIENGTVDISINTLDNICKKLNIDFLSIFNENHF